MKYICFILSMLSIYLGLSWLTCESKCKRLDSEGDTSSDLCDMRKKMLFYKSLKIVTNDCDKCIVGLKINHCDSKSLDEFICESFIRVATNDCVKVGLIGSGRRVGDYISSTKYQNNAVITLVLYDSYAVDHPITPKYSDCGIITNFTWKVIDK